MSIHFEMEPPYAEALRAAGLDSFDALMAARGGLAVSAHAERETIPLDIQLDGTMQRCFLKRVFRVPIKHVVAPLLRGRRARSQPLHEWNMLGALRAAGIGAMQRIAVGEHRIAGQPVAACLLVASVPSDNTFKHWMETEDARSGSIGARQRARLLGAVGTLMGRLSSNGFIWPDCQAKHLFAERQPNGPGWSLWLIDVERMERDADRAQCIERRLQEARDHLVRLRRSCPMARFTWRDYLHVAAGLRRALRADGGCPRHSRHEPFHSKKDCSKAAPTLFDTFAKMEFRPAVPDDQRPLNGVRNVDGYKMLAEYEGLFRAHQLDCFDRLFNLASDTDLHKPGLAAHRSRSRFTLTDATGREHTFYLKRYHHPPAGDQLRRIVSGSPGESMAVREYRCIRRLNQIGISTLQCVAVGQRMVGLTERQSFLITVGLNDVSLERYAADIARGHAPLPTPGLRRQIICQLALVARTLHAARYFHRDLYLSHVFLHRNADGSVALRLIDLARMLVKPRQSLRWKIKDLAALDYSAPRPLVTRADRVRFLLVYLNPLRDFCLLSSLGVERGSWTSAVRRDRTAADRAAEKQALRYHIPLVAARVRKMAVHDARRRETGATA